MSVNFAHADKPWILDTSSLIELNNYHPYQYKRTQFVWELLSQRHILIIDQVKAECKRGEATFMPWFESLSDTQRVPTEIDKYFRDALDIQNRFTQLKPAPGGPESADAYLIVAAREYNGLVVTEEGGWRDAPNLNKHSIPCGHGHCRLPSASAYYDLPVCSIDRLVQYLLAQYHSS